MKNVIIIGSFVLLIVGIGILAYLLLFFEDDPDRREERTGFFSFNDEEEIDLEERREDPPDPEAEPGDPDQEHPDPEEPRDPLNDDPSRKSRPEDREGPFLTLSYRPVSLGKPQILEKDEGLVARYINQQGVIHDAHLKDVEKDRVVTEELDLPSLHQSLWLSNTTAVVRYEEQDTIETTVLELIEPQEEKEDHSFEVSLLPEDIRDIAVRPTGGEIFSLIDGQGVVSSPNGGFQETVFSSGLTQWMVDWPASNTISLTTAPTGGEEGYMLWLDRNTGRSTIELAGKSGLTTLTSPDLDHTFYSKGGDNRLGSYIYHHSTGESTELEISTLPEKCVWSSPSKLYCAAAATPSGTFPDYWYQGKAEFNDRFYKIDAEEGTVQEITNERSGKDATHLAVGPNGRYLFFINRNDFMLHALDLDWNH